MVPVVALHFDRLSMPIRSNGYVQVPRLQVLCQLLKTDSLSVSTEDEVFDICVEYLTKNAGDLTDEQRKAIWSCCRFALLSPAALVEAQKNVGVQQFAQHEFELSLLARVLRLETDCEKLLSNLQVSALPCCCHPAAVTLLLLSPCCHYPAAVTPAAAATLLLTPHCCSHYTTLMLPHYTATTTLLLPPYCCVGRLECNLN